MGWAVAGGFALVLVALVLLYNHLLRARIRVEQAWAQVAVQQQRRHDLIPAVVEVARGHLAHERGVLDEITERRAQALATTAPLARDQAEVGLTEAVDRLLVLTEQYPTLRADATFRRLQDELAGTEDRLAFARGFANDRVARYRELIDSFPGVLVARPFRFPRQELFTRESDRAAQAPDVRLGG